MAITPKKTGPQTRGGDTFSDANNSFVGDRENFGVNLSTLNRNLLGEDIEFNDFERSLRDYALMQLGAPVVRVEMTNQQLKVCLDEAISILQYHAPQWMTQIMTFLCNPGQSRYDLPDWVAQNLEYVVYKKDLLTAPLQAGNKSLTEDIFLKYFQDTNIFNTLDMSQFYMIQQNLEMLRKILGNEGSWDIVDGQALILYPTPVDYSEVVVIYRALNPETIHPFYLNWLQKYTLACAKCILGTIRGKYRTLPSPGGGAQLDGASLSQAGEQEKTSLVAKLIDEIEDPLYFTMY